MGEQDRPAITNPLVKSIVPCVVWAVKFGASELIRSDILISPRLPRPRRCPDAMAYPVNRHPYQGKAAVLQAHDVLPVAPPA
jgi:hypothetical protein